MTEMIVYSGSIYNDIHYSYFFVVMANVRSLLSFNWYVGFKLESLYNFCTIAEQILFGSKFSVWHIYLILDIFNYMVLLYILYKITKILGDRITTLAIIAFLVTYVSCTIVSRKWLFGFLQDTQWYLPVQLICNCLSMIIISVIWIFYGDLISIKRYSIGYIIPTKVKTNEIELDVGENTGEMLMSKKAKTFSSLISKKFNTVTCNTKKSEILN